MVSKRADAPYRSGRTESWLNIKCYDETTRNAAMSAAPSHAGREDARAAMGAGERQGETAQGRQGEAWHAMAEAGSDRPRAPPQGRAATAPRNAARDQRLAIVLLFIASPGCKPLSFWGVEWQTQREAVYFCWLYRRSPVAPVPTVRRILDSRGALPGLPQLHRKLSPTTMVSAAPHTAFNQAPSRWRSAFSQRLRGAEAPPRRKRQPSPTTGRRPLRAAGSAI